MTAEQRQTSTAEFTREAVRLVMAHGYGMTEAARHVGINATRLGRWKRAREAREHGTFPGKGRLSPDQEELHRRREEHQRLRMAREMLQKAAAFFAHESSEGMPVWPSIRGGGRYPYGVRYGRSVAADCRPMCTGTLPPV
jgi:transposase